MRLGRHSACFHPQIAGHRELDTHASARRQCRLETTISCSGSVIVIESNFMLATRAQKDIAPLSLADTVVCNTTKDSPEDSSHDSKGFHLQTSLTMNIRIFSLICFSSTFVTVCATQLTCSVSKYGTPRIEHCTMLFLKIADFRDSATRLFDEEDLREGEGKTWQGVSNPFRTSIVQIPKYWSHGKSSGN